MAFPNSTYYVVPGTSSGDPIARQNTTQGASYQVVMLAEPSGHLIESLPTYYVWSSGLLGGANVHHLTMWNTTSSTQSCVVKRVFAVDMQLVAVTGVALEFDFKRCSAVSTSTGTQLVAQVVDTADGTYSSATATQPLFFRNHTSGGMTEGAVLFSQTFDNDEVGATHAADVGGLLMAGINWMPHGTRIKELTLHPGEGFTIKQITASSVGTIGWLGVVCFVST